jgi:hypothetical protein
MNCSDRPFAPLAASFQIDASCDVQQIAAILDGIDAIHRTPRLPEIRIVTVVGGPLGQFDPGTMALSLAAGDEHQAVTLVHELGHVLDLYGFDPALPDFASNSGLGFFAPWDRAVRDSLTYRDLRQQLARAHDLDVVAYLRYLVDPVELWARSYTQFIASRSGHFSPGLFREMSGIIRGQHRRGALAEQWPWEDFDPINTAIEQLLESVSWLR